MYKNRNEDGSANLCGAKIAALRMQMQGHPSQNGLAGLMQAQGIDLDKNAIQRIECGKRFVTDIELKIFAKVLGVTADYLLE